MVVISPSKPSVVSSILRKESGSKHLNHRRSTVLTISRVPFEDMRSRGVLFESMWGADPGSCANSMVWSVLDGYDHAHVVMILNYSCRGLPTNINSTISCHIVQFAQR